MEEEAPDAADSGKTEASSEEGPGEADYDLPPASFPSLLQEFSTRTLVSLGMIQNPFSGESQVDLRAAAYSIDMLAILQEKKRALADIANNFGTSGTIDRSELIDLLRAETL